MKKLLSKIFTLISVVAGGVCFYLFSLDMLTKTTYALSGTDYQVSSSESYTFYNLLSKDGNVTYAALIPLILVGVATLFMLIAVFFSSKKLDLALTFIAFLVFTGFAVLMFLAPTLYKNQFPTEFDTGIIGSLTNSKIEMTLSAAGYWSASLGIVAAVFSLLSASLNAKK